MYHIGDQFYSNKLHCFSEVKMMEKSGFVQFHKVHFDSKYLILVNFTLFILFR